MASGITVQAKLAATDLAVTTDLAVSNRNWQDVQVFLVAGATRVRLGRVTALSRTRFQVPTALLGGTVRLVLRSTGSAGMMCGLIVAELLANAFQHESYGGDAREVRVEFRARSSTLRSLIIADSGVGLPGSVDFEHPESLGMQLVRTLVDQLGASIVAGQGQGSQIELIFHDTSK